MTPAGVVSVIYSFGSTSAAQTGCVPLAGVIQGSDGILYGTTSQGGAYQQGAVYEITTGGAANLLYSFIGSPDGATPTAGLIQGSDGNFYGTTSVGGNVTTTAAPFGNGTVIRVTPTEVETVLYAFGGDPDGAIPNGGLVDGGDGYFYGTTTSGGAYNEGTVFRVSPAGNETVLYSFSSSVTSSGAPGSPMAGLVRGADGNFYGTTAGVSTAQVTFGGTVFKITPAGVQTVLHVFTGDLVGDSIDGAGPVAGTIQGSDGNFYGTTAAGGEFYGGTVYKVTPSGIASVPPFIPARDCGRPIAHGGLVEGSDGSLYGTTEDGGLYGVGTVFKLPDVFPPTEPRAGRRPRNPACAGSPFNRMASFNSHQQADNRRTSPSPPGPECAICPVGGRLRACWHSMMRHRDGDDGAVDKECRCEAHGAHGPSCQAAAQASRLM